MRRLLLAALLALSLGVVAVAAGSTPGADARLSKDCTVPLTATPDEECGGYVSNYRLVTGDTSYTDPTLAECSIAHGRQNEPSVAVDPRNTNVLVGSSNDYCGVYNRTDPSTGDPLPVGPIWLGYYRSRNGGNTWVSSLVPGYPDDASPYASRSGARTASAGDPVIAWDNRGCAFFGSESSDDPAGTPKTFGDVFVARFANPDNPNCAANTAVGSTVRDGLEYRGTTIVSRGSSAPNLLGIFNDKTAIEVDRTGGKCDGNVYFSYSRFNGNGANAIYFSRSTNHGVTFSQPQKLTASIPDLQFPDIAVTGNGTVYVTFRSFTATGHSTDAIYIARSSDCGQTFGRARLITPFLRYDAQDEPAPEAMPVPQATPDDPFAEEEGGDAPSSTARDCGDFADHCTSGYTFFRRDTQVRSTADQLAQNEFVYIVYDPSKPETQTATGTTYGSIERGVGSQSGVYFLRYDGTTGAVVGPTLIDAEPAGHQLFPDISADGGTLHALWWDSRNDPCYSTKRPVGNCGTENEPAHSYGETVPSLDVYATSAPSATMTWSPAVKVTDELSNPNYEQFDNRQVPFAGDYLWVTSLGAFSYGAWTDWRNTVQGPDPRESTEDEDNASADVHQCRELRESADKKGNVTKAWSGDLCPHEGGLDQDIYGDHTP